MLRLHGLWRDLGLGHHVLSRIDQDWLLLLLLLLLLSHLPGPAVRNHVPHLLLGRQRRQGDLGEGAVIEADHLTDGFLEVGHIGHGGGEGPGGVGDGANTRIPGYSLIYIIMKYTF